MTHIDEYIQTRDTCAQGTNFMFQSNKRDSPLRYHYIAPTSQSLVESLLQICGLHGPIPQKTESFTITISKKTGQKY